MLSLAFLFCKIFSPFVHTYFFHLASSDRRLPARCPRLALSNRGNPWDRPRSAVSPWACESRHAPSPSLSPWKIHCTKAGQVYVGTRSCRVVIRDTTRETRNWNIQRQWNGNRDAREKGSSLFARVSSISLERGRCKYVYSYRKTSSKTLLLQHS